MSELPPRDKRFSSDSTMEQVINEYHSKFNGDVEVIGNNKYNIVHIGYPGDIENENPRLVSDYLKPIKEKYPKQLVIIDWEAGHFTIQSHKDTTRHETAELWEALKSNGSDDMRIDEDRLVIQFEEHYNDSDVIDNNNIPFKQKVKSVRENNPESFIQIDEERESIHIDSNIADNDIYDQFRRKGSSEIQTWEEYKEDKNHEH